MLLDVLPAVGGPAKAAIDITQQSHTEAAQALRDRVRDLDETCRLPYAALMAGAAARAQPVLIATIVNALAYHSLGVDPDVTSGYLQSLEREESHGWVESLLAQIKDKLHSLDPHGRRLAWR